MAKNYTTTLLLLIYSFILIILPTLYKQGEQFQTTLRDSALLHENENNNTLKTKGYNLEHNFGHGQKNLSKTLCSLNILSFLFHTVQELEDELYVELRDEIGSREKFFSGINLLTTMFNFKSFNSMIEFILRSRQSNENIDMEPYVM